MFWIRRLPLLVRRVPRAVAFVFERALGHRLLGEAEARLDGMLVHMGPCTAAERVERIERLRAVLGALAEIAPRHLARLRDDCGRILVAHQGSSGYWPMTNVVVLHPQSLCAHPAPFVASELVHEGVHARYCRMGILPWPDVLGRIEQRCVREQMAFLERAGKAGWSEATTWLARLQEATAQPWWRPKDRLRMMRRAVTEANWRS